MCEVAFSMNADTMQISSDFYSKSLPVCSVYTRFDCAASAAISSAVTSR